MISIEQYLISAYQKGCSDIHLTANYFPMMRLHGELTPIDEQRIPADALYTALMHILTANQRKQFEDEMELDLAYEIPDVGRFRVNLFMQSRGIGAAFRPIPSAILSLDTLDMPSGVHTLANANDGLVIVTGPTGSGKSTTLASMIDKINTHHKEHILTIEDPIEYTHTGKQALINQRELSSHTISFANALRSALREDPDVILVGEMRDLETISLAITAAETGHLVFGTLHTKSAAETVDRIIDVFPSAQQSQIRTMLSNTLQGVVAQRLLRRADRPGRVAATEVLIATPAIRNLIRENKTYQIYSAIQTGGAWGMQTLDQCLKQLLSRGAITKETAMAEARDAQLFT